MATTENVMALFERSPDPVLTTMEVAGEFDITQQAAYEKLSSLKKSGRIEKKKVGARGVVWYIGGDYSLSSISSST